METKFLLPNKFKLLGWILIICSVVLRIYTELFLEGEISFLKTSVFAIVGSVDLSETKYLSCIQSNITYTLNGILFIIGGLLVAFSREKTEDEFISHLRLLSFQWSFLINYFLLFALFLFVYGIEFLYVMIYNMFTTLILFIARFHF